ncbi:calcium-binding protein [Nostoc sphaeroides CHAB 2801]|uniref:calcium-binding protein n=1 Tax=Nostoc sphaeroides TaxID=446679 RepID=UPI001E309462|nr:calcium-binding protein [Nostoc sphaeroides]MCC5632179.1 calcium-binding protein [Nostoc sphaeroides CHAB 2801]
MTGSSVINGTGNSLDNYIIGNTVSNTLNGAAGNDTLDGGDGNDTLMGSSGNDILIGGLGSDRLDGGDGIDTTSYANASASITVNLALATAQTGGEATGDILQNIENLLGSNFDDTLIGNSSNNILNGGFGSDSLTGGTGNDNYIVDSAGDIVTETSTIATEIDTVQTFVSYILGDNLESLLLLGTDNIDGAGNNLNNTLSGNSGDNILIGGLGSDRLNGVAGIDTASYINASAAVTVNLAVTTAQTGGEATGDILQNIENLIGSNFNDTLSGNSGDNILIGGLGSDRLDGVAGIDTASYINASAAVRVNLAVTTAQNGGEATGDILVNIENLIGSNFNDTLSGNSGNNILIGGLGSDRLDGVAGIDTASYINASAAVRVNLAVTTAQNGGEATGDILVNIENLIGSNFNDTLSGNSGNNILCGGAGGDSLSGGLGADRFVYSNFEDSLLTAPDRITDFNPSEGDRLVVNSPSSLPTALFNAGSFSIATYSTLSAAAIAAYADANPNLAGTQPIAVKQAIFFGWNGSTYLSVNDSIAAFNTSSDLLINVTGMNGILAAGSLTANNYFAA